MPSITGSIPDSDVGPIMDYLARARKAGVVKLDFNELLMCLLMARLGVDV